MTQSYPTPPPLPPPLPAIPPPLPIDYPNDPYEFQPTLSREQMRFTALQQKALMLCLFAYLTTLILSLVFLKLWTAMAIASVLVSAAAAVFIFLLSARLFSKGMAVLMTVLMLIPLAGLIVLLVVNLQITDLLKRNGARVGFLGASLREI